MDRIEKYQQIITSILEEEAPIKAVNMPSVENIVIADTARNHFMLYSIGWTEEMDNFIHSCNVHFDIIGGKIWLQANWTEIDFAERLVERGVPKSDIVIGFQPTELRPATGYAVG